MKTVTLKNGDIESEGLVNIIMFSLEQLFEQKPVVFFDLIMKCRDNTYIMFDNAKDILTTLNLINSECDIHNLVKSVVLSAVEGEGLNMSLGSPIA